MTGSHTELLLAHVCKLGVFISIFTILLFEVILKVGQQKYVSLQPFIYELTLLKKILARSAQNYYF
jgi:hypothetical protein